MLDVHTIEIGLWLKDGGLRATAQIYNTQKLVFFNSFCENR
jgi:hypothetical protein